MLSFNTKAIVLKSFKYKDSDKIYTVFSEDRGKISIIGKGVRKITSKRSGSLDTLNQIEVNLSPHKSGQLYISEVKIINSFKEIKKDYDLMRHAFYIVELVNLSTKEDEDTQNLYKLLVKTLESLESEQEEALVKVNKFEIKLMQLLGYEPPKNLLYAWRDSLRDKNYKNANNLIKNFVYEMIGEEIKSLELE